MSIVKANTFQDATGGSNAVFSGVASPPNSMGFRNRIINGGMVIDQRNAGASTSNAGGTTTYSLDRWAYYATSSSKFTIQQSTTAPAGFSNSLLITSSAATTINSGDEYWLTQKIEGFNTADLAWGTADAQTVTLSFRVRSSLTGTFGGSICNSAMNYYYAFSYTISAANTWETKTITISGPTAGTWIGATNGTGMFVIFGLSAGTTYGGATPGSWTSATYKVLPTGAVNILATNGATFYITGVQLEAGTNASPFERRDYGRELIMCQRYYQQMASTGTGGFYMIGVGNVVSSTQGYVAGWFRTTMRSTPSFSYSGTLGTDIKYSISGDATPTGVSTDQMNPDSYALSVTFTGATGGQALRLFSLTTAGQVKFSAEL